MMELIRTSAVFEGGVLKPAAGPFPNFADGDRVELVLLGPAGDATEVARRARLVEAFDEYVRQVAAQGVTPEEEAQYEDDCRAFDANRDSARKLFPPELKGVTW